MSDGGVPERASSPRPLRSALAEWVFQKKLPPRVGFLRALGTALLVVLLVQGVTGMLLALCYVPSPDHAYDSIRYIDEDLTANVGTQVVPVGKLLRGVHHYGSSAIVVLAFLHMARVYFTGAYKKPRALLWVIGVAIFGVLLGFGFTGYLLPWDMKGFWATDVGLSIVEKTPGIGPIAADLLRGGPEIGAPTLTRMFALHVLFLPALLVPLAGLHLFLVHKLGITPPGARVGEPEVKSEPFFPDHLFRELVVGAVVLAVIVGIVVVRLREGLGPPLEGPASRDAGGYEPRPEWYFFGLFQLLRLFKGEWTLVGTVYLPGGLALLALLLPWIDRSRERAPARRPFAVAAGLILIATIVGLTIAGGWNSPKSNSKPPPRIPVGDGSYVPPSSPPFLPPTTTKEEPTKPAESADPALAAGESLMRSYECTSCHLYRGVGDDNGAGGPDLADVGKEHDVPWLELYLLEPTKMKPDVDMPSAKDLGMSDEDRRKLAEWLKAVAK